MSVHFFSGTNVYIQPNKIAQTNILLSNNFLKMAQGRL